MANGESQYPHVLLFEGPKEDWNETAQEYDRRFTELLRPIFEEARAKGISIIHLSYLLQSVVFDLSVATRLEG